MQVIDKRKIKSDFNSNIYRSISPIFISSDIFWDGGINESFPLSEKTEFYILTQKMSMIIKEYISLMDEDIYIADFLCENKKMYAGWSDLKKNELFRIISKQIKSKKCYKLSISKDLNLIDLIIESNFKYLSFFSFYLQKANIIIQPTCHSEIIIYSSTAENEIAILENIAKGYNGIEIKYCKR